jgi:hypothetical protein
MVGMALELMYLTDNMMHGKFPYGCALAHMLVDLQVCRDGMKKRIKKRIKTDTLKNCANRPIEKKRRISSHVFIHAWEHSGQTWTIKDEDRMDVSAIANLATSMAQGRNDNAVSIAVLKKSMDMQSAIASQMIAALDSVPVAAGVAGNLPAHLGQNINTVA